MTQLVLAQTVAAATDSNGIEMGVLSDGTPYLTIRGLAKACGIAPSTLIEQIGAWAQGTRTSKLARMIQAAGYNGDRLSIPLASNLHAVPDTICILILEHYAMDQKVLVALQHYRVLARHGLREYIYRSTGFDPTKLLPPGWRDFHDRLLLSNLPLGYFGVFREMNEFLLRAMQAGLVLAPDTVPDISVGHCWAKHWEKHKLEDKYGQRIKCDHNYPSYYPQATSNPQEIWCYPNDALGAFRAWLDTEYIPKKFPPYVEAKVAKQQLDQRIAAQLIAAVAPQALPAAPTAPALPSPKAPPTSRTFTPPKAPTPPRTFTPTK